MLHLPPTQRRMPQDLSATIFVGRIYTMDANGSVVDAVGVDHSGHIVSVGSESHVRDQLRKMGSSKPETKSFKSSEVLFPGFIDPHMHLIGHVLSRVSPIVSQLGPCLPPPYAKANAKDCDARVYLEGAFKALKTAGPLGGWYTGMNMDPSPQPLSEN